MTRALLANNATTTVADNPLGIGATTINVADGSKFPSASYFYCTLVSSGGVVEIVKCTARTGNALTVVRAQEGTSAASFALGSKFSLNLTAAVINELTPTDGSGAAGTWGISVSGNAATATAGTNLAGGVAGAIPYQSGAGATGFSAAGTAGQAMFSGGTGAPTFATAPTARANLGVAPRATRIDIASVAGTVDLTATAPDCDDIQITGTLAITAFTIAAGRVVRVRANAAHSLVFGGSIQTNTGANIVCVTGDTYSIRATAANVVEIIEFSRPWQAAQIAPILGTVASNILTVTLNPATLDFRSNPITSGAVVTRSLNAAITLDVPNGALLGTVLAVESRIMVLAIDFGGTIELAVINQSGNNNLDETTLISTTIMNTSSDAANVAYSTTARSNVAFRVVGFIDIAEATAGVWLLPPTLVQGLSDGAASAIYHGIGHGMAWAGVTRTSGTTYYNQTNKCITLLANGGGSTGTSSFSISINGGAAIAFAYGVNPSGSTALAGMFIIPPGANYVITETNITSRNVYELA